MAYQPFPITPFKSGWNIDEEPFQIPMDGFTEIVNAHIKHGHVDKRAGYNLIATISGNSPIMGLYTFIDNTNGKETIGFTQTKAATLNGTTLPFSWSDLDGGGPIFDSGDSDFVWAVNWQSSNLANRLYFTNGKSYDSGTGLNGIRYYDGTGAATTPLTPITLGGTNELYGAKLLFVLKQRLICLNTYEFDGAQVNHHPQRCRWCKAQTPSNWNDVTAGGGGYVDAPTGEHIVSARYLQNKIVVYFTNSVWTLEPTSDPALPFRWKQLNSFRACDGKMASCEYDRYSIAIGNRGITASDGNETRRIDDRIQAFVENYVHSDSFSQVFALRDFNEKRTWILYPQGEADNSNGALIFDEDSSSWSLYDINFNVLGYADLGVDWRYSDFTVANGRDWTYQDAGEETYDSFYFESTSESFIGGDTDGNVFLISDLDTDNGTAIDLTLTSGNWNPYQAEGVEAQFGYIDFLVESDNQSKFTVLFYKDNDEDPYQSQDLDCIPDLGFINPVTNITQANPGVVTSYQHGLSNGDVVYIYGVDGMTEINTGPFTVTVIDTDSFSIGTDTSAYAAYTGDGQIFQREFYRTKVWKRAYAGGIGYFHQIQIQTDSQVTPMKFYEFKPYFRKRGRRTLG